MKIFLRNKENGKKVILYIPNCTLSIRDLYHREGEKIASLYSNLVGKQYNFVREERAFESFGECLLYGWVRE